MKVAVVINASAGGLIGRADAAAMVAEHLSASRLDVAVEPDDGRPLPDRIAAAVASGAEAVVVGGGDGTIACAAQQLMGTGVALGILPLGTMNLLAKDLAIPTDLAAAVDALATGTIRRIDVGEVNGSVFLCASVLGMPSRLARQRERMRGGGSLGDLWRMAVGGLRALTRYPPLSVELDLPDGRRRLRTRAIAVVDNDYDEAPGAMFARSRLDEGELVVYVAEGLTVWRALRLALGMALGRWRDRPELQRFSARGFVIRARRKRLRVMNDGEVQLLQPPLRYRIHPKAMRIIVPAAAAGKASAGSGGAAPIEERAA